VSDEKERDDEQEGQVSQGSRVGQEGQAGLEGQAGQEAMVGSDDPEAGTGPQGPADAERPAQIGPEPGVAERGSEAPGATAELQPILEALIFASPDPLTRKAIDKLLTSEPKEDIDAAIEALKRDYDRGGGLQLVEVAGGYQIVTRQDLHEWVRRLFHERTTQKLTAAALETLAVIAYKQPLTAPEITEIRGVNTAGVLNTLLERHLIKIVGRKKVVGRPFMYATTKEFLIRFGLNDLGDLPKVEDMADALGIEVPLLVEQPLSEEALPLEEPEESADPDADDPPDSIH
jgi:segregation and condensation protein B